MANQDVVVTGALQDHGQNMFRFLHGNVVADPECHRGRGAKRLGGGANLLFCPISPQTA